jgi:VIT1/CCC1 family predicted Fe2+/Mn2+ transporter
MEFLAAKVFADWITRKESNNVESIINPFKLKKKHIFQQKEIRDFFAEKLVNNIDEEDESKSKKLFKYLVGFLPFHKITLFTSAKIWQHFKQKILKHNLVLFAFVGVGVVAGAGTFLGAVVFVFAIMFIKELGLFYGILSFLFIFITIFLFGITLGILEGKKKKFSQSLWAKYELWYKTCHSLGIDHDTMAKVVGKSAMKLFEDV